LSTISQQPIVLARETRHLHGDTAIFGIVSTRYAGAWSFPASRLLIHEKEMKSCPARNDVFDVRRAATIVEQALQRFKKTKAPDLRPGLCKL